MKADEEMFGDGYESKRPSKDTEESKSESALLPKSLCPGMEPGDEIKLRIVETHDKDYLVEYVGEDDDEEEDTEEVEVAETRTASSPMDDYLG